MKNLILGITGTLLLALHVNAKQMPTPPTPPTPSSQVTSVSVNTVSVKTHGSKATVNTDVNVNWTSDQGQDEPMKSKTFSKSFRLDNNDKVNLSNQFGAMTIKTWDKSEIKVDVEIKAYSSTENEAQKLLDETSIDASKNGDIATFKTQMGDRDGNSGSGTRNGKKWRREVRVTYTIYMPANRSLTASQQYGNINLADFSGPTSLKVQYGNLIAGDLKNANNYINVQYGKTELGDVGNATIKHQYGSGITIAAIGNLDLNAQYAGVNITTVRGNALIKQQYGDGITIGSIGGALELNAQYAKFRAATIKGNISARVQYGSFNVDALESGIKAVDIDAQYSGVTLGFGSGFNADFNVSTSYGGFKYGSNVTAKKQNDDEDYSSSKNYVGQVGKGGSTNMNIKVQYNSVIFK